MDFPYGVTATVKRPAGQDVDGNPTTSTDHAEPGCAVAPAGSFEEHHLEATVEWDLDLYAPYDADFKAEDVVTLPGDTTRYQVHGRPSPWRSPFTGWEAGLVVRLKAVS